jgi:hypothetical protein
MAGRGDLSRGGRRRLLALAILVLLAHAAVIEGFSRWQAQSSLLRPMVAPMYTRVLEPEAAAPPPTARAEPPPAPRSSRIQAARSTPQTNTSTLPAREEPPPEPKVAAAPPEPPPKPAPEAPEATPSAPEPPPAVAEAPAAPASAPASAASAAASGTGSDPSATAALDSWPADTRLRYRLGGKFRSGELYGDARVLWQRQGERYQVRVEVEITLWASMTMTSQGEVRPGGLLPEVYEEVRRGRTRGLRMGEREVMLANGNVVRRPPGVQDTASQFVELSHRFATGREALQVGRAVSFWMARPGQVDLWTYDIVDKEVLRTRLGDIEAFHLKPRPIANPRGNITAEMWFAPSLQYLPVRIRVSMGDEAAIDLLVEGIEQR